MEEKMKSEKEKMVSGEIYNPANPRLVLDRVRANRICTKYNKKCGCFTVK